jgi:hypothetical protein
MKEVQFPSAQIFRCFREAQVYGRGNRAGDHHIATGELPASRRVDIGGPSDRRAEVMLRQSVMPLTSLFLYDPNL